MHAHFTRSRLVERHNSFHLGELRRRNADVDTGAGGTLGLRNRKKYQPDASVSQHIRYRHMGRDISIEYQNIVMHRCPFWDVVLAVILVVMLCLNIDPL